MKLSMLSVVREGLNDDERLNDGDDSSNGERLSE